VANVHLKKLLYNLKTKGLMSSIKKKKPPLVGLSK